MNPPPPPLPKRLDSAPRADNGSQVIKIVLGLIGSVFLLSLIIALVAVFAWRKWSPGPPPVTDSQTYFAGVAEAYSAGNAAGHPQAASIEAFLHAALADSKAFADSLDKDAYAQRVTDSGYLKLTDRMLAKAFLPDPHCPLDEGRVRLAHIVPAAEGSLTVVYVWSWDAYGSEWRMRWWLAGGADNWRIVDCELLSYGVSEATDTALFIYSGLHQASAYLNAQLAIMQAEEAADPEAVRLHLATAASQTVPERVKAKHALEIAYAWSRADDQEQALIWYQKSQALGGAPGAILGEATCHAQAGRWAEAEQAARRFEAILGPGVEVNDLLADCRLERGDVPGALQEYHKVLQADPQRLKALTAIAFRLRLEQMDELISLVEQADDPMATGILLARELVTGYHRPGYDVLIAWLQEKMPADHPEVLMLQGQAAEHRGDLAAAEILYFQALQAAAPLGDDVDLQADPLELWIYAAAAQGRLMAAYGQAPNPVAFVELAIWHWDEVELMLSTEQALSLLETQLATGEAPLDMYRRAFFLALEAGESARADSILSQLEQTASARDEAWEDTVAELQRELALAAGNWQQYDISAASFEEIADSLIQYERWEAVAALVDRYRALAGDDPYLAYVESQLACQQGKPAEALAALVRAAPLLEEYRYLFFPLMRDIINHPDVPARLPTAFAQDPLLCQLVLDSIWHDNGQRLEYLLAEMPESIDPGTILEARVTLAQARDDDQAVADLLVPWPADRLVTLDEWERKRLRENGIRSLIRLQRFDDAFTLARIAAELDGDSLLLLMVCIAAGDVEQAQAVAESLEIGGMEMMELLEDPLVGSLFSQPAWQPIRQRFDADLSMADYGSVVFILLKEPTAFTDERLKQALGRAPWRRFTTLEQWPGFQLTVPAGELVVAVGEDVLWQRTSIEGLSTVSRERLNAHRGWISVNLQADPDLSEAASEEALAQAVHALLPASAIALYDYWNDRLVFLDDETREALAAENQLSELPTQDEGCYLELQPSPELERRAARARSAVFLLADHLQREPSDDARCEMLVQVGGEGSFEGIWLPVDRVKIGNWGVQTITGHLDQPIAQLAAVPVGQTVLESIYSLQDWRITQPDGTVVLGSEVE